MELENWYKINEGLIYLISENSMNQYLYHAIVDGEFVLTNGIYHELYEKPVKASTKEVVAAWVRVYENLMIYKAKYYQIKEFANKIQQSIH